MPRWRQNGGLIRWSAGSSKTNAKPHSRLRKRIQASYALLAHQPIGTTFSVRGADGQHVHGRPVSERLASHCS